MSTTNEDGETTYRLKLSGELFKALDEDDAYQVFFEALQSGDIQATFTEAPDLDEEMACHEAREHFLCKRWPAIVARLGDETLADLQREWTAYLEGLYRARTITNANRCEWSVF